MKLLKLFLAVSLSLLFSSTLFAQEEPKYDIEKLSDKIYKFTVVQNGFPVAVIASISDDGILLVDTGQADAAENLKKTIQSIDNRIPSYIISTHSHADHIGGNLMFGADPIIIGHELLRERLKSGINLFDEYSDDQIPELTFSDSLSLYFNGEEIKLYSIPGCHDNCDIIVWFTGSRIACPGGLTNGISFPYVDQEVVSADKCADVIKRFIDILPDDVTLAPSHADNFGMDKLKEFHNMLAKTSAIVRTGLAEGKDRETLKKEKVLQSWENYGEGFITCDFWIEFLSDGYEGVEQKKTIYDPMYYALKEKDIDAVIMDYYVLKKYHPDEYNFEEGGLMTIGYKLYQKEQYNVSIKFYELSLKEFPEGQYTWLCYNNIGSAYRKLGDKKQAVDYYKKSLKLNPENTLASDRIKELEKN